MKRKVIYMAIDALTWTIINPLLKKGKLPNIQKLIKSGVSLTLASEQPLLTPIVWTSIFSGQKASKHGVTGFFDWYDDVKCPRIWDILNLEKNYSIGLFKVPVTENPPYNLNGFVVPAEHVLGQRSTRPPEYKFIEEMLHGKVHLKPKNIKEKILKYMSEFSASFESLRYGLKIKTVVEFLAYILWRKLFARHKNTENVYWRSFLKRKIYFESFNNLMSEFKPDFSVIYIAEADHFGHLFWKEYSDKYESSNKSTNYSEAIFEMYQRIDKEVGEIISNSSPDTTFVLMSDHGMDQISDDEFAIDSRKLLKLLNLEGKVDLWKQPSTLYLWPARDKKEKLSLSEIEAFFDNLVFAKTNEKVFRINYNESNGITASLNVPNNKRLSKVEMIGSKKGRAYSFSTFFKTYTSISGNHHLDGVFVMSGPNIKNNCDLRDSELGISIYDIVPTLLYDLKMKIGHDMDGKVRTDLFKESFTRSEKIEYIKTYNPKSEAKSVVKDKPQVPQEVLDNLKRLGYID